MSNVSRDIGSEDLKVGDLVTLLRQDKYLIPTFQRDFVWEPANIPGFENLGHMCPLREASKPCSRILPSSDSTVP